MPNTTNEVQIYNHTTLNLTEDSATNEKLLRETAATLSSLIMTEITSEIISEDSKKALIESIVSQLSSLYLLSKKEKQQAYTQIPVEFMHQETKEVTIKTFEIVVNTCSHTPSRRGSFFKENNNPSALFTHDNNPNSTTSLSTTGTKTQNPSTNTLRANQYSFNVSEETLSRQNSGNETLARQTSSPG